MSIQNESKEGNKYYRLDFVEFLDLLCRAPTFFDQERLKHGVECDEPPK